MINKLFLPALPKVMLLGFMFCLLSCVEKANGPIIVDFSKKTNREEFEKLKLDSVYTNLLQTHKTEEEGDSLYNDWLAFNKEFTQLIKKDSFDWETPKSKFIYWHRVYCQPDGTIDYYLYNIVDSVSNEKVSEKYADYIKQRISSLKYPVKRDFKYFQCGSKLIKN